MFLLWKEVAKAIHVDHFIPWSFVKDDKRWNFVLTCPNCNIKKSNKVLAKEYLVRIEDRNKKIQQVDNVIVTRDFEGYSDEFMSRIWKYAKISGLKELHR